MSVFKKYRAENNPRAWLFLLPALVIVALFNFYPLFRTFWISLQKGTLNNLEFNGIKNYITVLSDTNFHAAIGHTTLFTVVVVPVCLILSMLIAYAIFDKIKFKKLFETIFFIPYLTSIVAIAVVFRYLLNGDYGFINYLLGFVHIGPIDFLNNPSMSMTTVILFGIWSGLAFNIIILLSGLRSIDQNYYKVADMFGASKREQFFRITLPQLTPMITFLLIVNVISSFKIYTQVYSLFNGKAGIANSATTAVFYIYQKFYIDNRYGQGMAAAVILFVIILVITILQRIVLKRLSK